MFNHNVISPQRQPRADLSECTTGEIVAELTERYTAAGFGWLADLMGQAREKGKAATDPALREKHTVVFWHLAAELRRRAG